MRRFVDGDYHPDMDADTPQSTSPWRRWASVAGCVVLGAVLLFAAWAKVLDPAAFADKIRSEGLDIVLSGEAVAWIALFLELFLGAALLLAVRHRTILWPTAALVAFFVFLTSRTYWRFLAGVEVDDGSCGCFGKLVERTPEEAFWQDLLLLVPPLALAFLARAAGSLPRWRLIVAGIFTAGMLGLAWKAPELPLDNLATRLKPGVDPVALCAGSEDDGSRTCLDAILPELREGEHLVILADLGDDSFASHVETLNEYYWSEGVPALWVVTASTEEELFQFRFTHGPTFEIREAPAALLSPLYRTLPRTFSVQGGRVAETWSGLPPFEELGGSAALE